MHEVAHADGEAVAVSTRGETVRSRLASLTPVAVGKVRPWITWKL